ncbi:MAG TPA: response regulator transcription factor [Acidimicrobiales bacterium]|jgi:DNA-binding response OmpR family regulator|nr:response regulator transcription factor [Acidimicrobiales bacterium]
MRILIAEDDRALREVLQRGLREAGYVVDAVETGEAAEVALRRDDYEIAVLDWRMPGRSGIEVVDRVRRAGVLTPILLLTARDAAADRVVGLNAGADDYLIKPFDFPELLARLRALQRRPALRFGPVISCGDLHFDPSTRQLRVGDELVDLTTTESLLIEVLMRRSPSIVSRETIAHQVWDDTHRVTGSNAIDVHVARLRAKLTGSHSKIETVRSLGYRVVPR